MTAQTYIGLMMGVWHEERPQCLISGSCGFPCCPSTLACYLRLCGELFNCWLFTCVSTLVAISLPQSCCWAATEACMTRQLLDLHAALSLVEKGALHWHTPRHTWISDACFQSQKHFAQSTQDSPRHRGIMVAPIVQVIQIKNNWQFIPMDITLAD